MHPTPYWIVRPSFPFPVSYRRLPDNPSLLERLAALTAQCRVCQSNDTNYCLSNDYSSCIPDSVKKHIPQMYAKDVERIQLMSTDMPHATIPQPVWTQFNYNTVIRKGLLS